MKVTKSISSLLKVMADNFPQVKRYLGFDDSVKLFSGHIQLIQINSDSLILCNHDFLDKLLAKTDKLDTKVEFDKFVNFMRSMSNSFLRLNHLGISYAVKDVDIETEFIKSIVNNTGIHLYEEPSFDTSAKWLFVGNTASWESPLFEIVLTKDVVNPESQWRPHFQIDIDTSLSQEKLENVLSDSFGDDFIKWRLDIPNYGVVLEMGMLGSVRGTKIYLGVGTDLRDTRYHRETILQKIL